MSVMTKTVSSECSSLSDIDCDPITSTFAKLRAVISQEASLRKELDNLFAKRTEEAHIAAQNAQNHLEMVKSQEAQMREILKTESTAANEMHDSASNTRPEDTVGRERVAKWEHLQEAAMMSIIEQHYQYEAEKIRQEQESDRLGKLEDERLAELETERLAKEEVDRLIAQEAEAEAEQRQLEEERWAKEENDRIQEAAMVAEIEARERQREEAEIEAQGEAEKLRYEQEAAFELELIERAREAEEDRARLEEFERLEQEQMEAERYRLDQEAQQKIDDEWEAQQLAEIEQRRADEERQRKAQEKAERTQKVAAQNNKIKRARQERVRLGLGKREKEENERLERLEEQRLATLEAQRLEGEVDEREREYRLYILLRGKAIEAERSLDTANLQLAELEAQRNRLLREVEDARWEEAGCRYHEITRRR